MKLLDKIKDLFMDEVTEDDDDEEAVEQPKSRKKEEPTIENIKDELPKVMRDTIEKEEKPDLKLKDKKSESEDFKDFQKETIDELVEKKFNFPINFEDDFVPKHSSIETSNSQQNVNKTNQFEEISRPQRSNVNVLNVEREAAKKVSDLYANKEEPKEKPKFKASPVISPVYGVLDKNYKKDEVIERDEEKVEMKRPSKKVDFETVRKKAFGNLTDEIKDNLMCENCELYKEVKRISSLKEDDLLYDMTVDSEKDVTIEKAYDNYEEFGVAYEPKIEKRNVEPIEDDEEIKEAVIIDRNKQEEESATREDFTLKEEKIEAHDEEIKDDSVKEKEEEIPSRGVKKKETKVDEDFFELIDSMYKERSDD